MDRDAIIDRVLDEVQPFTMVHPDALILTVDAALDAVESERPGALVECGTWMGGASFAMLLAQRYAYGRIVKPVWMLDSFKGLPPAGEKDGPTAIAWQQDTKADGYFDNCTAPLDAVRAAAAGLGFSDTEAIIVPGWFEDTIPPLGPRMSREQISVLRVDCDWYEPVLFVLETLAPCVVDEGRILIDDYFAWDGCTRAVHDFLSRHDLAWRVRSVGQDDDVCAWMIKT